MRALPGFRRSDIGSSALPGFRQSDIKSETVEAAQVNIALHANAGVPEKEVSQSGIGISSERVGDRSSRRGRGGIGGSANGADVPNDRERFSPFGARRHDDRIGVHEAVDDVAREQNVIGSKLRVTDTEGTAHVVVGDIGGDRAKAELLHELVRRKNGGRDLLGIVGANKDIATDEGRHLQVTNMGGAMDRIVSHAKTGATTSEATTVPESLELIRGRGGGTPITVATKGKGGISKQSRVIDVAGRLITEHADTLQLLKRIAGRNGRVVGQQAIIRNVVKVAEVINAKCRKLVNVGRRSRRGGRTGVGGRARRPGKLIVIVGRIEHR
jgi:hypothetical protein